jgi:hypothetical protein
LADAHELLPLVRKKVGDFLYPYGAFPDADFQQREGYETEYQTPSDDEEGDGERYRTEILVSAEKLVPLFVDLCELLPPRVHVSLERASADMYSRWDEFVSDEVDRSEFLDVFNAYRFAFAEDGNLGLGAFASHPAVEVFLGSHKEIVVFARERTAVAEILRRHRVEACALDPYYRHDHQHVPLTDYRGLRGAQFDYLHVADVVRHALGMQLQEDDDNVDDDGQPLGLVPWHAVVIASAARRARAHRRANRAFVQEFGLTAASRGEARELLERRLAQDGHALHSVEELFRVDVSILPAHVRPVPAALEKPGIWWVGDKTDAEPHPGP